MMFFGRNFKPRSRVYSSNSTAYTGSGGSGGSATEAGFQSGNAENVRDQHAACQALTAHA